MRLRPQIYKKLITKEKMPDIVPSSGIGQNKIVVCPFVVYLGAVNNSETGQSETFTNPKDFNTFSKIFTGQDSVLIVWENSTFTEKVLSTDSFLTKKFKAGTYYTGTNLSKQFSTIFTTNKNETDFAEQQLSKEYEVRLQGELQDADFFKF